MITLAYGLLRRVGTGSDDGLTTQGRTLGGLILSNRVQFYYFFLAFLFGGIYLIWRVVNSHFGHGHMGVRSNEQRMQAIGFHANRCVSCASSYQAPFAGSQARCLPTLPTSSAPAMIWTRSGDLMVMVILSSMAPSSRGVLSQFTDGR